MDNVTNQDDYTNKCNRKPAVKNQKSLIRAILIICAGFTAFIFVLGLLMDRENPKVIYSISNHAASYINDTYPDNDFIIGEPSYSMMASTEHAYTVRVHSPSSPDTYFTLSYNLDGGLTKDSYHDHVTSGANVRTRLHQEFSTLVETALAEISNIEYLQASMMETDPDTGMRIGDEKFVIDGTYDIKEFGQKYGSVIIKMEVDAALISFEETVKTLRKMDELLRNANISYQTLDLELYTSQYTVAGSSFTIYDVTSKMLHSENSDKHLWQLWEKQEQHRKDLKEQWANES